MLAQGAIASATVAVLMAITAPDCGPRHRAGTGSSMGRSGGTAGVFGGKLYSLAAMATMHAPSGVFDQVEALTR